MLNLFTRPLPPDVDDGFEEVPLTVSHPRAHCMLAHRLTPPAVSLFYRAVRCFPAARAT